MENNSWKVSDIAGSDVFDVSGERLGVLIDVLPTGGNDVWVVRSDLPQTPELMIPALQSVVREVSPENKRIVVELPPGLRDVYKVNEKGSSSS